MLMPSIFGEDLFDEMMSFTFDNRFFARRNPVYGKAATAVMKTDVKDMDGMYEISMDLPGFSKENINAELKDGYLTVSATTSVNQDDSSEGRYIRRERYCGSMSRSFYVGDAVKKEDIKARFENGILALTIPKVPEQPKVETPDYIAIEG